MAKTFKNNDQNSHASANALPLNGIMGSEKVNSLPPPPLQLKSSSPLISGKEAQPVENNPFQLQRFNNNSRSPVIQRWPPGEDDNSEDKLDRQFSDFVSTVSSDEVHAKEGSMGTVKNAINEKAEKSIKKNKLRKAYGVTKLGKVYTAAVKIRGYLDKYLDVLLSPPSKYTFQSANKYDVEGMTPERMKQSLIKAIKDEAKKINLFEFNDRDIDHFIQKRNEINAHIQAIENVREEKSKSEQQYKSTYQTVKGELKRGKRRGEISKEEYKKKSHQLKTLKHAEKVITLSDLSVRNLKGLIEPLLSGDVGSYSLTLKIGISAGAKGGAKGSLFMNFSQNLWIEDDRKIRMSAGATANASGEVGLAGVLGGSANAGLGYARTKVFASPEQWAAYTGQKCFQSYFNHVRTSKALAAHHAHKAGLIDKRDKKTARKNFSGLLSLLDIDAAENYKEIERFSKQPVTKVNVFKGEADVGFDVTGIFGAGANVSHKVLDFRKKDKVQDTKKHRTANVFSVGGNLKVGNIFNVQGAYTRISNHANPDNDGSYLNLKIITGVDGKLGIKGSVEAEKLLNDGWLAAAENFENKLLSSGATLTEGTAGDREIISKPLDILKGVLAPNSLEGIFEDVGKYFTGNISSGKTTGLEINLVHTGGHYKVQYTRTFHNFSANVEGSVNTGTPVNVDFGVGVSKGTGKDKKLGTNTLTYLLTVYNGLTKRKASQDKARSGNANGASGQWKTFLYEHKPEMAKIFEKISSGDTVKMKKGVGNRVKLKSTLMQEIILDHQSKTGKDSFNEMESAFDDLQQACLTADNYLDDGTFDRLINKLNRYFYYLSQINQTESDAKWK